MIMTNSQKLGITINRKTSRIPPSISEEEVNAQAIQRVKIKEITAEIINHEVELQDEMSKDKINELIELYQKAIEYYSAVGDKKFDQYLEKVRKLLADEIVLDVLSGKPPPKKNEIKPLENKKVREFEDLEVWPSGPPGGLDTHSTDSTMENYKKDEKNLFEDLNLEDSENRVSEVKENEDNESHHKDNKDEEIDTKESQTKEVEKIQDKQESQEKDNESERDEKAVKEEKEEIVEKEKKEEKEEKEEIVHEEKNEEKQEIVDEEKKEEKEEKEEIVHEEKNEEKQEIVDEEKKEEKEEKIIVDEEQKKD